MSNDTNTPKPVTYQGNLAKLPRALAPLIARPQWAIWRWIPKPGGGFQKPPSMATQPNRHVSVTDPNTWSDYATALAAVQAKHGNGLSYVLTKQEEFAAIDMDHCRDVATGSVDPWAQLMLEQALHSYAEITPSGNGLRIWGLATGDSLHRKFPLDTGDNAAVELFRATSKALTISGLDLRQGRTLGNIDRLMDWCVFFGEKHKPALTAAAPIQFNGNGHGLPYSLDEIELIVSSGVLPTGANRSDLFHAIVGHYVGCGQDAEQIAAHIGQFPDGIGGRYLREGRLRGEVDRSVGKYNANVLPGSNGKGWTYGWETKALQPDLDDELDEIIPQQEPSRDLDPELEDDSDPELEDDLEDEDPEPAKRDSSLPPLYAHGDTDRRSVKSWLIKLLIPTCGHGLLSGQWGAGKTFIVFELAAALGNGQPFLGHVVKRQCGVLLIAAEGANEVRLRLDAVVRAKCGAMQRAPFRWYETAPLLLHKDALVTLIAMARQAEISLQEEFGLPLGLIVIDTIAACAGYARAGDENDPAAGQAVMNVLKAVAQELDCFVLGVDHFGKNLEAGTRGASSKEASCDVVLACLGDKELSGSVSNTRLAVRKNRGGQQGREYPFVLRAVNAPEADEDGEPVTTMVVDWVAAPPGGARASDPWAQGRKQEQRTAALRLKRVLMAILADQGVELPIPPDGPVVRMVAQKVVQKEFYMHTPADGTPEQKRKIRYQQFNRALAWAEDKQLIGVEEIDDTTYLRLTRPNPEDDEEEPGPE
jgi:hypothetical protein